MKTDSNREKFGFEKRWTPYLKDFGFVPVSSFFLENYHRLNPYDLTYGEAIFVVHLMQHKWDENAPFPAYKTIAQGMHVSTKTARRLAGSLEAKGYLKGGNESWRNKPLSPEGFNGCTCTA